MLPSSIRTLVMELLNETKEGKLVWSYNSDTDVVNCIFKEIIVLLEYKFDFVAEYGTYKLNVIKDGKVYYFTQSIYDGDFDLLQKLHYEAQGSDFKL